MRNRIKITLMVALTFCLLIVEGGGPGLKSLALADEGKDGRKKGLDFIGDYIATLDTGTDKNIFFIEDQNSDHLESMKRILFALNFRDKVLQDPESGNEAHFWGNSGKIIFPDIEFIKINPTKYRLRIHRAENDFPLIFNEAFHDRWTIYLKPWNPEKGSAKATTGEPTKKLKKISSPFDISTVVRNKKLPRGDIWETWFPGRLEAMCREDKDSDEDCFTEDPKFWNVDHALHSKAVRWPEVFHWKVNGYANSWWLDLDLLKNFQAGKGQKAKWYNLHPDGSVDFEVVIEFWPQRLFYLGILISGIVVAACIGFLIFHWVSFSGQRQRKNA